MKVFFALALLLTVLATGAAGEERLKDEYQVWEHTVSLERLEAMIADKLEDVKKVKVLSVKEYSMAILFDMNITTSDGEEYQFSKCALDEGSKSIYGCQSDKATLDEIEFDFEELAPTGSPRRFRLRK